MQISPEQMLTDRQRGGQGTASGRWTAHFVIALGCLSFSVLLAMGIIYHSFSLFALPWSREFGISRALVGLVPLAGVIGGILIGPFNGWILDHFPGRMVVAAGHFVMGAGLLLITVVPRFWEVLLINVCLLGPALHLSGLMAAQTLTSRWAPSRPGAALTVVALGSSLGGFVVPPLMAPILGEYGWQVAYRSAAAFVVIAAAPLIFLGISHFSAKHDQQPPISSRRRPGRGWIREIVFTRSFWVLSVGMFTLATGTAGFQHSLAPYARSLGLSVQESAFLIALFSVAMIVGKAFWGVMIDRMEEVTYFAIMAFAIAIGFSILALSHSVLQSAIGLCIVGLGGGGTAQYTPMSVAKHFGADRVGRALSLAMVPISLSAIGAPMAGAMFDRSGSYHYAFAMFGFLALFGYAVVARYSVRDPETPAARTRG